MERRGLLLKAAVLLCLLALCSGRGIQFFWLLGLNLKIVPNCT
jgi:hypothetical protein